MASHYIHKPENALKRANELINIGNKKVALELLHGVLTSRRYKTWQKVYETMMVAYMDLCVDLQEHLFAKDGLHQYRNMSQQQAPGSLELVINHLVDAAEARAAQAQATADAAAAQTECAQVADLEAESSPEAILLSTMTEEGEQERRERAVVVPWLKFLWETYRAVLDILRSNSKLEHVYHGTCRKAFAFCGKNRRMLEFRRLCETMRQHVGHLQKHVAQHTAQRLRGWDGFTPESVELHLQTRFAQLKAATALEVWTEAFRTIEDIYSIMQINKKAPKARLMAAYFEQLTRIFWVSQNRLFHAYAWLKYYQLGREYNKVLTEEEKRAQAGKVLLAALAVPEGATHAAPFDEGDADAAEAGGGAGGGGGGAGEGGGGGGGGVAGGKDGGASFEADDVQREKRARMALLLGFAQDPSRAALLRSVRRAGVLDEVPEELRALHAALEGDGLLPRELVQGCLPLLEYVAKDEGLAPYAPELRRLAALKLLGRLGAVYHTVRLADWQALIAPLGLGAPEVERLVANAALQGAVAVRVDHRAGCLRFGRPGAGLGGAGEDQAPGAGAAARSQLTALAARLQRACARVAPGGPAAAGLAGDAAGRAAFYGRVRAGLGEAHREALERKQVIERRKEELERAQQERAREEEARREREEAQRLREEAERRAREARLREREKQLKIDEELELQKTRDLLKAMGKDASAVADLGAVDSQALLRETREAAARAKEETAKRAQDQAKKLDYITRAVRMEELPVLEKRYAAQCAADREAHAAGWAAQRSAHRAAWEAAVREKARTAGMWVPGHREGFEAAVLAGLRERHAAECEAALRRARAERRRALLARARRRKAEEDDRRAEEEERARYEAEARARREAEEAAQTRRMVPNQALMDDDDEDLDGSGEGGGEGGSGWRRGGPPAGGDRDQRYEDDRRGGGRDQRYEDDRRGGGGDYPPEPPARGEEDDGGGWRRAGPMGRRFEGGEPGGGGGSGRYMPPSRRGGGGEEEGGDGGSGRYMPPSRRGGGGEEEGGGGRWGRGGGGRGGGGEDEFRRGGGGRGGGGEDEFRRGGGGGRGGGEEEFRRGGGPAGRGPGERPRIGQGGGRSLADLEKSWR